ncbi:hypothetical protein VIGAN_02165400, partial [Vigna angularis var. angularis]
IVVGIEPLNLFLAIVSDFKLKHPSISTGMFPDIWLSEIYKFSSCFMVPTLGGSGPCREFPAKYNVIKLGS